MFDSFEKKTLFVPLIRHNTLGQKLINMRSLKQFSINIKAASLLHVGK